MGSQPGNSLLDWSVEEAEGQSRKKTIERI